jgi:hypothetical protein
VEILRFCVEELRGINSAAVYARKVKYYIDIKTGSYKFVWKELKYWGLGRGLGVVFFGRQGGLLIEKHMGLGLIRGKGVRNLEPIIERITCLRFLSSLQEIQYDFLSHLENE